MAKLPRIPEQVELVYNSNKKRYHPQMAMLTASNLGKVYTDLWQYFRTVLLARLLNGQSSTEANSKAQATEIMGHAAAKALERFRTEVAAGIGNVIDPGLNQMINLVLSSRQISHLQNEGTSLLPDNLKLLHVAHGGEIAVVEIPSHRRSLVFAPNIVTLPPEGILPKTIFRLALPHMIFVIRFIASQADLQVFYRNEPLTSTNDMLHMCSLPNTLDAGKVCMGSDFWPKTQGSLRERVHSVINHYWQSKFTNIVSYAGAFIKLTDNRVNNLWRWEQESELDPQFVLGVDWPSAKLTVEEAMLKLQATLPLDPEQKNQMWRLVKPHSEAIKTLIQSYCREVEIAPQYLVDLDQILADGLDKILKAKLDETAEQLEREDCQTHAWQKFLELMTQHTKLPPLSEGLAQKFWNRIRSKKE